MAESQTKSELASKPPAHPTHTSPSVTTPALPVSVTYAPRRADVIQASSDDGVEFEPVRDVRRSTDTAELRSLMQDMRAALQTHRMDAQQLRHT